MNTCFNCSGEGYLRSTDEQEAYHGIMDPCYHCETTGKLTADEQHYHNIFSVATGLATREVLEMKRDCNQDPHGEGWSFRAAECGMQEGDYTTAVIYDTATLFGTKLLGMTLAEQDFMLADTGLWFGWNDWVAPKAEAKAIPVLFNELMSGDDIPF